MKVSIFGFPSEPIIFDCKNVIIYGSGYLSEKRDIEYYHIRAKDGYFSIVKKKNTVDILAARKFSLYVPESPQDLPKIFLKYHYSTPTVCIFEFENCMDLLTHVKEEIFSKSTRDILEYSDFLCEFYFVRLYAFLEELGVPIHHEKENYHVWNKLQLRRSGDAGDYIALETKNYTKQYYPKCDFGREYNIFDCMDVSSKDLRKKEPLINDILFELREDFFDKEKIIIFDVMKERFFQQRENLSLLVFGIILNGNSGDKSGSSKI